MTVLTPEELQYPMEAGTRPPSDEGEAVAPAEATAAEPTLAELIDGGESASLEYKATLRKNLHTGQHDPAVEHGS